MDYGMDSRAYVGGAVVVGENIDCSDPSPYRETFLNPPSYTLSGVCVLFLLIDVV